MTFPDSDEFKRKFRQGWDSFTGLNFARNFRYHGGMKYYVLWLLNRTPMKGAEIINQISNQTMGWWRPSPGTIYPLLSNLEREGLVKRLPDLRYELTEKGREEIGVKVGQSDLAESINIDKVVSDFESYLSYLEEQQPDLGEFKPRLKLIIQRLKKLSGDVD
ncbi:MAG: PadR family transcriptional regulator [Thermoplasmataceae archaeon]